VLELPCVWLLCELQLKQGRQKEQLAARAAAESDAADAAARAAAEALQQQAAVNSEDLASAKQEAKAASDSLMAQIEVNKQLAAANLIDQAKVHGLVQVTVVTCHMHHSLILSLSPSAPLHTVCLSVPVSVSV